MAKSDAVKRAEARRAASAALRSSKTKWFIDEVQQAIGVGIRERVTIAAEYLKTRIVKNISIPVRRIGTRVVERSKPGEFPRADTTELMKDIFTDYGPGENNIYNGHVGTTLDYGLILETKLDRSFLERSLDEEMAVIESILIGKPIL